MRASHRPAARRSGRRRKRGAGAPRKRACLVTTPRLRHRGPGRAGAGARLRGGRGKWRGGQRAAPRLQKRRATRPGRSEQERPVAVGLGLECRVARQDARRGHRFPGLGEHRLHRRLQHHRAASVSRGSSRDAPASAASRPPRSSPTAGTGSDAPSRRRSSGVLRRSRIRGSRRRARSHREVTMSSPRSWLLSTTTLRTARPRPSPGVRRSPRARGSAAPGERGSSLEGPVLSSDRGLPSLSTGPAAPARPASGSRPTVLTRPGGRTAAGAPGRCAGRRQEHAPMSSTSPNPGWWSWTSSPPTETPSAR